MARTKGVAHAALGPISHLKSRARTLSRRGRVPLHEALDRVAVEEGYATWSLLMAREAHVPDIPHLSCAPGTLALIAARPGLGKTRLALRLCLTELRRGRPAQVFSLDYTPAQITESLADVGATDAELHEFALDTSDAICAEHIAARLAPGAVAVVDYLQLLDQCRAKPPLAAQVPVLRQAAQAQAATILCLSQIDRHFLESGRDMPGPEELRLPNPADLSAFSSACFLGKGRPQVLQL